MGSWRRFPGGVSASLLVNARRNALIRLCADWRKIIEYLERLSNEAGAAPDWHSAETLQKIGDNDDQ